MKKFRQITVDGDSSWAWAVESGDRYYNEAFVIIWKDKNRVYSNMIRHNEYSINRRYPITPGLIARFIKLYLKQNV